MLNRFIVLIASKLLILFSTFKSFFLSGIDVKSIPIIINNRNRYTFLKMQIDALASRGYHNLIIIDNKSTYPPLLEYYKTLPYKVLLLEKNLGYLSLQKLDLYQEVRKSYFVYTDSDVVPIEDCPDDFMQYFLSKLRKNFWVSKIGFSLKTDDLPDHYDKKKEVVDWESQFYQKKIGNDYEALVDTTFALHKPYALISTRGIFKMLRTGYPYQAYHMPWYNDSANITQEEKYYTDHVEIGTHWSKGLEVANKSFLGRLLLKLKGK